MNFKIEKVKIGNFKCFDEMNVDVGNRNIISGANECGKSSFASAILWALTGKDVEGNSTFEIVPKGKYGTVSPIVTLDCFIDNKPVELKREYKAKFTRDKAFSDYVTVTYINGIETGVKKFQEWIDTRICKESVFKILSNPKTFIEDCPKETKELVWQAQRRFLMQLIETSESDFDIVKQNQKFALLEEPLNRYDNASQYLTLLKKQYSELQKSIDAFDIRIQEQEKGLVQGLKTEDQIKKSVERIKAKATELKEKNKQYKLSQQADVRAKIKGQIDSYKAEKEKLEKQYNEDYLVYTRTAERYKSEAENLGKLLEKDKATLKKYAEALDTLKNTKPTEICQTCGQPLKPEMIQAAKKKLAERIKKGEEMIVNLRDKAIKMQENIEVMKMKSRDLMQPVYPPKAIEYQERIDLLTTELVKIPEEEDLPEYQETMESLKKQIKDLEKEYFMLEQNEKIEKEIQRIEQEHKENTKKLSETQKMLDLARKFVSYKCKLAEDRINSLFENVRFELFQQNKSNDEIKETCSLTFRGIKYNDLSYSTKIIAGLEVVKAFEKFYNVTVPIFIDNAESITETLKIDSQCFLMYVKDEYCPECGGESGRKTERGTWVCKKCKHEWKKKLEITEG